MKVKSVNSYIDTGLVNLNIGVPMFYTLFPIKHLKFITGTKAAQGSFSLIKKSIYGSSQMRKKNY